MRLATVLAASVLTASFATGCAFQGATADDVAASSDAIVDSEPAAPPVAPTGAALALVNSYENAEHGPRDYADLELKSDGTYAARVNITHIALCIRFPCVTREIGSFVAKDGAEGFELVLTAENKAHRTFAAKLDDAGKLHLAERARDEQVLKPKAAESTTAAQAAPTAK